MTTYNLTKAGREWKGKGTHATAVIEALEALKGKATGAAIADYVVEKKLLAGSKMDEREACSWVLPWCERECSERRSRSSRAAKQKSENEWGRVKTLPDFFSCDVLSSLRWFRRDRFNVGEVKG